MGKGQIVYRAKEIICLHCGERQALKSTNFAEWREECAPFEEEHKGCRKQELGKMTFEEWFEKWWGERTDGPCKSINVESIARAAWEAALTHDPAKAHAEPVAFAQVLENGDLRISANGLRVLSSKLDKSRVIQPLYLHPEAKKMTDTQQKINKLTEHVANLEAEVAPLNNAVSLQPTLRDSMAAHALTGLLACPMSGTPSSFSKLAYKYADAMLKEREK